MPLHAAGELAVDVEAIVRQQHDDRGAIGARLIDLLLHILFANAEFPLREHPARIGDGVNGKAWPITAIFAPPRSNILRRLEDRLLPLVVADVLRQERERRSLSTISFTRSSP